MGSRSAITCLGRRDSKRDLIRDRRGKNHRLSGLERGVEKVVGMAVGVFLPYVRLRLVMGLFLGMFVRVQP